MLREALAGAVSAGRISAADFAAWPWFRRAAMRSRQRLLRRLGTEGYDVELSDFVVIAALLRRSPVVESEWGEMLIQALRGALEDGVLAVGDFDEWDRFRRRTRKWLVSTLDQIESGIEIDPQDALVLLALLTPAAD